MDVEKGFEPRYVTIRGKGKILTEIKRMARGADAVILATDPDREGEAIAFHVAEYLGFGEDQDSGRFQRVEFREITRAAITRALDAPSPLDMRKVEAQQARRILDRLGRLPGLAPALEADPSRAVGGPRADSGAPARLRPGGRAFRLQAGGVLVYHRPPREGRPGLRGEAPVDRREEVPARVGVRGGGRRDRCRRPALPRR